MVNVSIIIPVYNVEKYIIRCMESVRCQTYTDVEVILVDDCGTDASISLVQRFIKDNELIAWKIIHHQKNMGLSVARNTGIQAATGRYVYFLDSDDTISKDCLSVLVDNIENDTDYTMAMFDNVPPQNVFPNFGNGAYLQSDIIEKYIRKEIPWNSVNRLIRKSFLLDNGLFFKEGIISEDLMWNFLLLSYVRKVNLVEKITYHYFVNQNSIMRSCNYNYKYANDLLLIEREMNNIVKERPCVKLDIYHKIVKYEIIPQAILWHHYPIRFKFNVLHSLFLSSEQKDFRKIPFKKRYLFLFSPPLLTIIYILNFWIEEYKTILLKKMRLV
ncbi:MAG: glycosyltransferase family 2 protein [Bacteroidales bacterium]|nr:glycosyltransferase family 2 protein [Bacteroidales bacterium]